MTRASPRSDYRTIVTVLLIAGLALVFSVAAAQVGMGASIPESSSLVISHTTVEFNLAQEIYPPAQFPAYYDPISPNPISDPMTLTVFTNLPTWSIDVSFTGLYNEVDNLFLAPDQLEYSTSGGVTWHPFSWGGNTIIQGLGPTAALESHPFEVRLRIDGHELPGVYEGALVFTLTSQ